MILPTSQEGLVLQKLRPEDAEPYFNAVEASREHLAIFCEETNNSYPDLESVQESIVNPTNPDKLRFGIWNDETFVGTINLRPEEEGRAEIGYWVDARHTGNGYATLATSAIAAYAYDRKDISDVYAVVVETNRESAKVLEKAGFTLTDKMFSRLIFSYLETKS